MYQFSPKRERIIEDTLTSSVSVEKHIIYNLSKVMKFFHINGFSISPNDEAM